MATETPQQVKRRKYNRAYAKKNKASISANKRAYYSLNKEKIRMYTNSDSERERRRIYMKKYWLEYKFGITPEVYEQMLESQGGVCAICGLPESVLNTKGETKLLCVDHCHKTEEVRELLCTKCNSVLGFVDDDISILQNAVKYLKKHKKAERGN